MDIKQIFNSCYKCEEISYEPHGPKYFSRQTSHKLHWNIQYNLHLIAIISYKNQFLSSKLREKKIVTNKVGLKYVIFLNRKKIVILVLLIILYTVFYRFAVNLCSKFVVCDLEKKKVILYVLNT